MRKIIILLLSACGITASALAQGLVGDWNGQINTGFKVRVHFERVSSGFSGKLINPSGNETVLDQITSDGTHLHFAVNKLNLSYDGVWNAETGPASPLLEESSEPAACRTADGDCITTASEG